MSVIYRRAVRFEEVDAAGIAFFARFFNWCHEAMERFYDDVPDGYVGLITRRRVGFPAVHLTADWRSPLRYGDVANIETSVTRIGTTSATLRYVLTREADGVHVATIEHVTVATDLDTMTKRPLPDDCRALLERHLSPPA
ncbi:MAG: acyl-CoA thioesterase [Labilithrix sp.]|nr:acyl-CoA thioesterase [Labilithrix sp.]MCW5831622.1 acyl-CoA thioesterase [Labilithrix sp.]